MVDSEPRRRPLEAVPGPSNAFGLSVRSARESAGLTQAELASKLRVSPNAVGLWERGLTMPRAVTRRRLHDVLGLATARPDGALDDLTQDSARSTDAPAGRRPADSSGQQNAFVDDELVAAFKRSLVRGLTNGDAKDANWTLTAQFTAKLLGVPWEGP